MDLIADEHKLDRQQERAIYELTLKKQRSKKSTVSRKQVAAMQQLANELLMQRKSSLELLDLNHNEQLGAHDRYPPFKTTMCHCHSLSALGPSADQREAKELQIQAGSQVGEDQNSVALESGQITSPEVAEKQQQQQRQHQQHQQQQQQQRQQLHLKQKHIAAAKELQRQCSTSTIATTSTSSSTNSASSASSSSHEAGQQLQRHRQIIPSSSFISSTSSTSMSEETNMKLNKLRLEQLNNELERRLHQYEYLVAQEKAILGTYNINLFANESVNNFHLFNRLDQKNIL